MGMFSAHLSAIAIRLSLLAAALVASPALALDCPTAEGRDSLAVAAGLSAGERFEQTFGAGWRLVLDPVPEGWRISILNAAGDDLSWATPPRHGPNARDIYGWHFRNAANTGPNTGDVNAPQHLRLITFFPDTGEFAGVEERPAVEPAGRGALEITDMSLADLTPGQQARMVYVKFAACLSWPSLDEAMPNPTVSPELIEQLGACGLQFPLRVSGHLDPPGFSADIDGDGSLDTIASIIDEESGQFGIAICRAGTRLDVLGITGPVGELTPDDFEAIDLWHLYPRSEIGSATVEALGLVGDSLFLGHGQTYETLLYWQGEGYATSYQGN